jgi:hypothetical protein
MDTSLIRFDACCAEFRLRGAPTHLLTACFYKPCIKVLTWLARRSYRKYDKQSGLMFYPESSKDGPTPPSSMSYPPVSPGFPPTFSSGELTDQQFIGGFQQRG